MKQAYFFRVVGVWMLLTVLPVLSRAEGKGLIAGRSFTTDSIPKQDDKGKKKEKDQKKDEGAEKGKEVPEDPKAEPGTKRPAVKEVPKARPKLRPAVVTDKIKIKKPPIKVKGLIRSMGI